MLLRQSTSTPDAIVVGSGPAGSAVARLLASWGHEVAVLPGPGARGVRMAESLPPSCRKPLAALGVLESVESGGFLPNGGNTSSWAEPGLLVQSFGAGESGFQVERGRFDDLLLAAALDAGARVIPGASAREIRIDAGQAGGSLSRVDWAGPTGTGSLTARWLLDCSGRTGVLARRGLRRRAPGPATTALVAVWRSARGWPGVDDHHTLIEAYPDGWIWSVPVRPDIRYVAAMIDPRLTATERGGGLEAMYRAELAKSRHLRRMLEGATKEGPVRACAATRYGAIRHGGDGFLLVGDAGCFLDPLSSFGVKKALASGCLAAAVVHTCLEDPAMKEDALRLFEQRERSAHAGYAALAARQYARGEARYRHPFWIARAEGAEGPETAADGTALPAHAERAARAFEVLRASSDPRLRSAPGLRRVRSPTVEGRRVVLREHVANAEVPEGIRFVRGVELPVLVDAAEHPVAVPELFERYGRARGAVELPDFLGALATLLALGMLEHQSES